ncbi:gag-pol polyprotein [Cucumis melo var. makuwa]|nr:gag-pol polyprotein [Cucumis melo var. makuwa]
MTEEETIAEFNVRVLDIANELDALGEKMSNSKLVWKLLRSLPSKFNMKVTMIEEANDLSKMKLDELFGSLRTFELHLGNSASRRKPCLALTSVKEESTEEYRVSQNNDSLAESMVLLTKQIAKLKSQLHKHIGSQRNSHEASSTTQPRTSSSFLSGLYRRKDHERNDKDIGSSKIEKSGKGIRCHECEGFGHIQSECATYLKHKKKSLVATLSDEEDYSESDDEEVGMALISIATMNEEESHTNDLPSIRPAEINENYKVALTSVNNPNSSDWYFDNGYSRHMIGNAIFFSELSECNAGSVVFGDGGKGRIIGNGTIDHPGSPYLLDVCLVHGLSANLISISQLCDQGYQVISFSKDRCNMAEEASLWHKRLGHISGTSIAKVAKVDVIIGFPSLTFNPQDCCSDCPTGKQVKSSHKSTYLPSTERILELLHTDLMGTMQIKSLGGGGRYALVCVDDISRYTWVKFIYDKSETFKPSLQSLTRTVMESINVIIDNHEKVSNGSVDEEDGDIWAPYS